MPAPIMRERERDVEWCQRLCAIARATMMKLVQMATVMIAAAMPIVRFESCMAGIIGRARLGLCARSAA